ncbi:hypothetical protein RF11_00613 [Thelohanellus kitauei]|uniref:Tc1-like transposase DDE domain-containing protein n=1 Tax=Thelohanellus kitauei TaxID=669202 RepID=A0A0C2M1B2_THEKT|nr:hypothetical protein RF11_00613 [Thelohanellus kitauei]
MSCEGMVNFRISVRENNTELFLEYLFGLFEIFRARENSETYLVMDNVPFRKTQLVQNMTRSFNPFPIYLRPIASFKLHRKSFNLMERLVRQANSRSAEELLSFIETCSSHITSNDWFGFHRHDESNFPDYIQGCPVEN